MDAEEKRIFTLILILIVVIGTIIYYFFASLRKQHKRILELKMQNMTAGLNSVEEDRARIASDLHDDLSPLLSAIKLKVSSFDLPDEGDRLQQQKTNEHLSDILRRMREISFNLMPVALQRQGLLAALTEFVNFISNRDQLVIDLQAEDVQLTEAGNIHLYRIVQEIVHNTIKHANASLLQIALTREGNKIILSSKDNGKGFNYQQRLREGGGFGLRNLLSRTDVLGGELFIESKEGIGTVYTIELPTQ